MGKEEKKIAISKVSIKLKIFLCDYEEESTNKAIEISEISNVVGIYS